MQQLIDEETFRQAHEEAVEYRRRKFEEVFNREPRDYEIMIIREWARMFWREFL